MKDERETRQRLLACAKKEFMEKGYTKASLRSICRKAEVTTGALYFFFRDKADLFAALVEGPLKGLYELMLGHYQAERETKLESDDSELDGVEDMQVAVRIMHYMYQHYDAFLLMLTKSEGSGYEDCIDSFVEITQRHYRILSDRICRYFNRPLLDEYLIHWISHMQIDTFVHMITHVESEEEACRYVEPTVRYLFQGFFGMLNIQME